MRGATAGGECRLCFNLNFACNQARAAWVAKAAALRLRELGALVLRRRGSPWPQPGQCTSQHTARPRLCDEVCPRCTHPPRPVCLL